MKEFVAITDELFYSHPELYERLVPFTHDIACRHLLQRPIDIEGYADIIEYSIVDPAEIAANDSTATDFGTEREVQVCNAR